MGESRQELLAWANSLLQLNLTKVEQFGTGGPYCQIYDSIFLDLPMARVKFNVNTEYAYLENFKILSSVFKRHQIERSIPVQQLIKCKMQDNLEFLQWTKRFWDQYFPGGDYDALARRKGQAGPPTSAVSSMRASTTKRPTAAAPPASAPRTARAVGGGVGGTPGGGAAAAKLQSEVAAMTETVAGLERERDFYFSKLRDIELLVQGAFEAEPELENDDGGLLKQIQNILYSTEEGFEIPAETEEEGAGTAAAEEETF